MRFHSSSPSSHKPPTTTSGSQEHLETMPHLPDLLTILAHLSPRVWLLITYSRSEQRSLSIVFLSVCSHPGGVSTLASSGSPPRPAPESVTPLPPASCPLPHPLYPHSLIPLPQSFSDASRYLGLHWRRCWRPESRPHGLQATRTGPPAARQHPPPSGCARPRPAGHASQRAPGAASPFPRSRRV